MGRQTDDWNGHPPVLSSMSIACRVMKSERERIIAQEVDMFSINVGREMLDIVYEWVIRDPYCKAHVDGAGIDAWAEFAQFALGELGTNDEGHSDLMAYVYSLDDDALRKIGTNHATLFDRGFIYPMARLMRDRYWKTR